MLKNFLLKLFSFVVRSLGVRRVMNWVAFSSTAEYVTFHNRPASSDRVNTFAESSSNDCGAAIVMQGPIIEKDQFTLETLRLYRRHFPTTDIIVSTWDGVPDGIYNSIKSLGVELVQSQRPELPGIGNVNLQIISSRSGIARAGDMGARFVLKTRTDQRMYSPSALQYMHDLARSFPIDTGNPSVRGRIVGCSLNTFKYRMYGLSDMLTFGHTEDLLRYWSPRLDNRTSVDLGNDGSLGNASALSLREFALSRVCEVYLATEYLHSVGHLLQWTLQDSWLAFARFFLIIDRLNLDLFWPKYSMLENRWLSYGDDSFRYRELNFNDWLILYTRLDQLLVPEEILDM